MKMANNPLGANARRASWLALGTSSLKTTAQVLQRPGGECECQRPSQRNLMRELPWK